MFITEKMFFEPTGDVRIFLIWKTQDEEFKDVVRRYRNNKIIAQLTPEQFFYSRRGEYLVATIAGNPEKYPNHWSGVGEWRIDPNIRGNVRGCI